MLNRLDVTEAELVAFGLSVRESRVYLMILQVIEAPASTIARRCGFPRLSTYVLLERLIELNLVYFYIRQGVRYYRVNDPQIFLELCHKEIQKAYAKEEHVKRFLPRIKDFLIVHSIKNPSAEGHFSVFSDRTIFLNRLIQLPSDSKIVYSIYDRFLDHFWPMFFSASSVTVHGLVSSSQLHQSPADFLNTRLFLKPLPDGFFEDFYPLIVFPTHAFFIADDSSASFLGLEIESAIVSHTLIALAKSLWKIQGLP